MKFTHCILVDTLEDASFAIKALCNVGVLYGITKSKISNGYSIHMDLSEVEEGVAEGISFLILIYSKFH